MGVVVEVVAHFGAVETQKIDGFAHFCNGVGVRLTRFANKYAQQLLHALFHQIRGLC